MKASTVRGMESHKKLWAYVLMDAIQTLIWGKMKLRMPMTGNREKSHYECLGLYFTSNAEIVEDQEWFLSKETSPGSFIWICHVLSDDSPVHFNPDHLVLALKKRGLLP